MPPSTFDWVTFGIAILGVSLAVIGLFWQVLSWTWTGSRVKVDTALSAAEIDLGGGQPTWVDFVEVTARNRGRTAVDVLAWYVVYDRKNDLAFGYFEWESWQGPEVPVRLEPGQAAIWRIDTQKLWDGLLRRELPPNSTFLYGQVLLGTGKRKRSRRGVTLESTSGS